MRFHILVLGGLLMIGGSAQAGTLLQAECWLDDDPNFDWNQTDGGLVFGGTSGELNEACRLLAAARFGDDGSSRTRNETVLDGVSLIQGECWLDDDPDFDWNQTDAGLSLGRSSLDLLRDCRLAQELRYPDEGSFGIRNAAPVADNPTGIKAECWLDDDPNFDWNQTSGGEIYGASTYQLRQSCQRQATERFGDQGSSGIRNVQTYSAASPFLQGDCWIDDDPNFDWNQVHIGVLIGTSSDQLTAECAMMAQSRYGDQGSSGVRDVVPYPERVRGFQAECWLDDDPNFDWNQTDGGLLYGRSTYEIRQACERLAQSRFGDQGSSGVRNVTGYDAASSLFSGDCWLDDDPNFDWNQTHGGLLYAHSPNDIFAECDYLAKQKFGDQGSYGVRDMEPFDQPATGVEAECWLDDDPNFDWNQTFHGVLRGRSSYEIRCECEIIAADRYGEQGSFGLAEIGTF